MDALSSPIPQISVWLAPPEEIPVEPYSPFANVTSFNLPQAEDSFRPMHLTPPPTHTSFRRQHLSPLGSSKDSPEDRPKQTGKGLDRARFEALLNASKEKPLASKKDATDLRREALIAHQSKQARRRALFLSKLAPPSPTATVTPKTPPESPAIFHYSLPSPGLISPIAHYESLQEQEGGISQQTWVEQVDFRLLSKPKPRPAPLRQPLPSLEQISARMNGQRNQQQAYRNDIVTQTAPPMPADSQHRLVVGRLRMPVRNTTVPVPTPTIMVSEFNDEDSEPEFFESARPPKSPLRTTPATPLQLPVPRTRSVSPTKLTQANLPAQNSRESRSSAMLTTLRRRTQSNNLYQPIPRHSADQTDTRKEFRRHSAPPDSMDLSKRSGFEHPILRLPGAF